MEMRRRLPIGVELVKRGIVTEGDIEKALEYQKDHPNVKLGDILYELDICNSQKLIEGIGDILGEPGIILTGNTLKIKPTEYLPLETCKKNKCIPFELNGNKIKVCFSDKSLSGKMDPVKMLLLNKGLVMEEYITFEKDIEKILNALDGGESSGSSRASQASGASGTIVELVDEIIRNGMQKRASDIHIEPLAEEVRVRYRIDGELITTARIGKDKQQQVIGRLKAISNMHQEKQEAQDRKNIII